MKRGLYCMEERMLLDVEIWCTFTCLFSGYSVSNTIVALDSA